MIATRKLAYPAYALALGAGLLSGCAGKPALIGGAPGLQVVAGELPPPTAADLYARSEFSGVRPFDTLLIDVFGIPELSNRKVRVDGNGEIGFPLIGTLTVAGMSTREISQTIAGELRGRFIRDPQVTTNLEASEDRSFTVYGSVREPGVYPVVGEATLIEAVARARGIGENGDSKEVVVFRTVEGQRMATLYNLDAISRGVYDDPRIYPNDTVVVGESEARRLFDTIIDAATVALNPITILLAR
jgi:polysaccharide export outer membrane protein